ncbi:MAG: response regulator [Phycisphaerales bacterium]|nr:response regulator [Phycisphaerales bacterium]MCB9856216.1 response regulator [Phycisphaerales bacterium]MCB9863345.1 response regulator [Phycisphaerales bacterium]
MTAIGSDQTGDSLRTAIEAIADQLCLAVDGHFDFRVDVDVSDPSAEKLHMLINFVLDAARRSIEEQRIINEELQKAMAQVESARMQAECANRAKSDFLANMSHELRTPLTAIIGFSNILREDCKHSQRHTIDTIHRNGEHLLHVISDILDLSKIESGRFPMARAAVRPVQLVDSILGTLHYQAAAKGLDVRSCLMTTIPNEIQTDPVRFRQILTNLISNAVKFTNRGGVTVEMSYLPNPDDLLSIDVVDTGIGIDAQHLEKLFRPFSQVDSSMSRNFGGTGLGLVICRRFAELLDGSVSIVESHPDKGSRFRCRIAANTGDDTELIDPADASALRAEAHSPTNADASVSIRGLNILLVEDGPDNRRLILHILKKKGAIVATAENGQIGVDLVEASITAHRPFDLILMDMQMPVMDGYTATSRLRSMDVQTPIIALTAHAMTGDREKCIAAGCDDYITKPIAPEELIRQIAARTRNSLIPQ